MKRDFTLHTQWFHIKRGIHYFEHLTMSSFMLLIFMPTIYINIVLGHCFSHFRNSPPFLAFLLLDHKWLVLIYFHVNAFAPVIHCLWSIQMWLNICMGRSINGEVFVAPTWGLEENYLVIIQGEIYEGHTMTFNMLGFMVECI